jgi:hypothetical protein
MCRDDSGTAQYEDPPCGLSNGANGKATDFRIWDQHIPEDERSCMLTVMSGLSRTSSCFQPANALLCRSNMI